jgi:hypothetical protein
VALGADRLKLGAAVGGVYVLGVYDRDGAGVLGADRLKLGAAVGGVYVLGVYDRDGVGVLGADLLKLGAAVGGVNVRGVYDRGGVESGVAVELCGQVERENLDSGVGSVEVVRGVGVIVTLGVVKVRGVTLGVVEVRGVTSRGVRLLGVRDRGPAGAELPGNAGCCGATWGPNVLWGRVGPAAAPAAPEPPGMALSRLSRLSRISCWRAVTAESMAGPDGRRDTPPAPNAGPLPPVERLSTPPPWPALGRRSTSR